MIVRLFDGRDEGHVVRIAFDEFVRNFADSVAPLGFDLVFRERVGRGGLRGLLAVHAVVVRLDSRQRLGGGVVHVNPHAFRPRLDFRLHGLLLLSGGRRRD